MRRTRSGRAAVERHRSDGRGRMVAWDVGASDDEDVEVVSDGQELTFNPLEVVGGSAGTPGLPPELEVMPMTPAHRSKVVDALTQAHEDLRVRKRTWSKRGT